MNDGISQQILSKSKSVLSDGGIIIFPTETVYGLGADIFNEESINRIYKIKGRDFNKPLAAHISSINQIELICDNVSDLFCKLAENFLPGPLSIVVPNVNSKVPKIVTSGLNTIAIRYPDNDICRKIIDNFNFPLAATSANVSGHTSPINFSNIEKEIIDEVDLAVDGGECYYKMESTVISIVSQPKILRQGVLKKEDIEEVLNQKLNY